MPNKQIQLNSEQQAIIQSVFVDKAPLTIVEACPGSGKTRVFVEVFKQYLDTWGNSNGGVAALSFTNVAQEEIKNRLGGNPVHPHFVGTLDSFVYQYVIKPFGHLRGLPRDKIKLVPNDLNDFRYNIPRVIVEKNIDGKIIRKKLFDLNFTVGTVQLPKFSYKTKNGQTKYITNDIICKNILEEKGKFWREIGKFNHSDSHYISARIIERHPEIISLIRNRFPVLLIDELQDTGTFLGQVLSSLFSHTVKGFGNLVVGDPDQGIYGFAGVDPCLLFKKLKDIEGAVTCPLDISHRCPETIVNIANTLSSMNRRFSPANTLKTKGEASLIIYDTKNINSLKDDLENRLSLQEAAILSRNNNTIKKITAQIVLNNYKLSGCTKALNFAANYFLEGNSSRAKEIVSGVLERICFPDVDQSNLEELLQEHDSSLGEWRTIIFSVLKNISHEGKNQTWGDWVEQSREFIKNILEEYNLPINKVGDLIRKPSIKQNGNTIRNIEGKISTTTANYRTIHKAKGLEYDTVAFVIPPIHKTHNPCPSESWQNENDKEEMRIAFVAVTRAKERLLIYMHKDSYTALCNDKPEFIKHFNIITDLEVDFVQAA